MKWRELLIIYFGLINISTQDIKVFSFCIIILTMFYIFYKTLPEDGYNADQILDHKQDFQFNKNRVK